MKQAAVVKIRMGNTFLFLKRFDASWCLPGGKREAEDLSPTDTAIREVREETGIEIAMRDLVYVSTYISVVKEKPCEVFVYDYSVPYLLPVLCSNEHERYVWKNIQEALEDKSFKFAGRTLTALCLHKSK